MNENDLRVIRTKESIRNAFLELLAQKPLDKITVTELAKTARINKGTFYLHYQDIDDLYNHVLENFLTESISEMNYAELLFDDPEQFFLRIPTTFGSKKEQFDIIIEPTRLVPLLPRIVQMLIDKLYETGRIERSVINDIRLKSILSMFSLLQEYSPEHGNELTTVLTEMVRAFFPAAKA